MRKRNPVIAAWILLMCCLFILTPTEAKAAQNQLKLNVKKLNMTIGGTFQLRIYNKKKNQTAEFVSSNPALVSVDSISSNTKKAVLRASGVGDSLITVTIQRKKLAPKVLKCRVSVSPGAISIKFMKKKINLKPGQLFHPDIIIKPSSSKEQPIFESSNPAVAQVTPFGVITAHAPGSAIIRATLLSTNLTTFCTVTVKPPRGKPKTNTPWA